MNTTHESFYSNIAHRYGAVWLNKVKEFVRQRIKRKKLECGLQFVVQCRDNGVVPKFAQIKPVKCIRDYEVFFRVASEKFLCRVIADYRRKVMCTNKNVYELHLQLSGFLDRQTWDILDAMTHSRTETTGAQIVERHYRKLSRLTGQTYNYPHKNDDNIKKESVTVLNLSSKELTPDATKVLSRGLNYAPTPNRTPIEDVVSSIENAIVRNRIPHNDAECLRQDVSSLLRKSSPPKGNITHQELMAVRDLRNDQDILVLPADKGNATVVVDTEAYESKITQLVSDQSTYKKVNYNPTTRVTRKTLKILQGLNNPDFATRLRPLNPTPPKIYGLPKIHKPDWPLRPIVSQIDAPTYKLSRHLATMLQPFTGKTNSYVKDSRHFVNLLSDVILRDTEIMVSFDITSLFTNVPVEESINIIQNLVKDTDVPTGYIDGIRFCLESGYFLWRGQYYLQVDGVAMGSPLAPVVANIFMEWFEERALNTGLRPRYWWRYVDDIFTVVNRDSLADLTEHLNSVHPKIQCTVEEEKDGVLPFLDVLIIRGLDGRLSHTVYRKPTHTDRYLHADSHHHPSQLSSVPRSLINRALSLCDPQYVQGELKHLRHVLESNGYRWRQCIRVAGAMSRPRRAGAERAPAFLPYIRGVTDKIGHLLRRRYNIRTIFRPPGQLRQLLRSPKDRVPLEAAGVYTIPCDCGLSYVGETRRSVATRLREHIGSMKSLDSNRSAVAEHACNSDTTHYIRFDKATVLAKEKYFVPRKVREAIEISRRPNFNRDTGWGLSPAWRPALKIPPYHDDPNLECDIVSAACTLTHTKAVHENPPVHDTAQASNPPIPTAAVPQAPTQPSSARSLRQTARWARGSRQ